MSVYRVHTTKCYTVMSNYHLRDRNMSLKAKGLLSVMLSLPDTWDYTMNGLCAICKENTTAIKSSLDELKELGYLVVTKKMPSETTTGRFEYQYDIYELPKQGIEKQGIENLGVEFLPLENVGQINTYISSTDNKNTKEKIKETNKEKPKDAIEEMFDQFYEAYPKHVGRSAAEKAFKGLKVNGELLETMLAAIERQKKTEQWQKNNKQFIPNPSTWLNQRRWEDEVDTETESRWG